MDPDYERRRGMPTWAIVLLSCGGCGCFALVALFGGAMFLGFGVTRALFDVMKEVRAASIDLKVQDDKIVTFQGRRYIVGTLKNISTRNRYSWVAIDLPLYEGAGKTFDSVMASTTEEIPPGGTWRFRAPITNPKAV